MKSTIWYKYELRVRYQETDQMGVVYHVNYLNWFEIGRTELIRAMGMSYQEIEERGLLLPVLEADIKFKSPARYDDRVAIYTRFTEFSHVRIRFESEVRRLGSTTETDVSEAARAAQRVSLEAGVEPEGELLVKGSTRHAWLNRDWKLVRIDKEAPDIYRLLEQNSC